VRREGRCGVCVDVGIYLETEFGWEIGEEEEGFCYWSLAQCRWSWRIGHCAEDGNV
jgi:hypothetical protein